MAMAGNLTAASGLTYQQLDLAAAATTIKTKLGAFIAAASPLFDDNAPNDRPVGNWLIPMQAVQTTIRNQEPFSMTDLAAAVSCVYRMMIACKTQIDAGLMSASKGTALLAAWNAQFGT